MKEDEAGQVIGIFLLVFPLLLTIPTFIGLTAVSSLIAGNVFTIAPMMTFVYTWSLVVAIYLFVVAMIAITKI